MTPKQYDKIREAIQEELAVVILQAYVRGEHKSDVVTERREDYQATDKILKIVGIKKHTHPNHRSQ